jgi:hypothetical protein
VAELQQVQAASALFEQFETVFQATADLFARNNGYKSLSRRDANTLLVPFAYLLGALDSLGDNAATGLLAGAEAILVGAKDFRPPAGLGGVRSQFCYIVVLKDPNTFELRNCFPQPPTVFNPRLEVWCWQVKLGEFGEDDPRPSSLYAAQVAKSYTLFSNDREEIQTVAELLALPNYNSGNLSGIREWPSVSQHGIWGYRRYRHTGVADRTAAGMRGVTPGAQALIFFPDLERKVGVLRLLNSPEDERTAENFNSSAKLPPFKPSGSGAWETIIPFSSDEKTLERMAVTMGLFGFGLYL